MSQQMDYISSRTIGKYAGPNRVIEIGFADLPETQQKNDASLGIIQNLLDIYQKMKYSL